LAAEMRTLKGVVDASRPTAVNLMWATARVVETSDAVAAIPSVTLDVMKGRC
jgi:methylthioribose-1-phosphate isomerase